MSLFGHTQIWEEVARTYAPPPVGVTNTPGTGMDIKTALLVTLGAINPASLVRRAYELRILRVGG